MKVINIQLVLLLSLICVFVYSSPTLGSENYYNYYCALKKPTAESSSAEQCTEPKNFEYFADTLTKKEIQAKCDQYHKGSIGHGSTASVGSDGYNSWLSRRRKNCVAKLLPLPQKKPVARNIEANPRIQKDNSRPSILGKGGDVCDDKEGLKQLEEWVGTAGIKNLKKRCGSPSKQSIDGAYKGLGKDGGIFGTQFEVQSEFRTVNGRPTGTWKTSLYDGRFEYVSNNGRQYKFKYICNSIFFSSGTLIATFDKNFKYFSGKYSTGFYGGTWGGKRIGDASSPLNVPNSTSSAANQNDNAASSEIDEPSE
jgi:hypothetical protein